MDQPSILFVDDDPDIAEFARTILEAEGYRAFSVRSGDIALVLLQQQIPFELLITDVVLPGTLDGYALAVQARMIRPGIRVVYSTGFPDVARVRAQGAIFGETLRKPWSAAELLALTAAIFRQPAAMAGPKAG